MFPILVKAVSSICLLLLISSCSTKPLSNKDDWNLIWSDEFEDGVIDTANWTFDLGTGAPSFSDYGESSTYFSPEGFPSDNFSVRWEGQIKIDYTSEYTFYTISDDGVRLPLVSITEPTKKIVEEALKLAKLI